MKQVYKKIQNFRKLTKNFQNVIKYCKFSSDFVKLIIFQHY